MNTEIKINYNLIEYLLEALDSSKPSETVGVCCQKNVRLSDLSSVLEAQMLHAAHEVKQFIDEMPGGFLIYHADESEEIIYANESLLRLFDCESMEEFLELTGNSFQGIVHPEDLDEVEKSICEQIGSNQYDLDYVQYRIVSKNGEVRWVDDYGHFIHSEFAGYIFYVFIVDVTEKKRRQDVEKEILLNEKLQKEQELKLIHQEHLRRLEMIEGLSVDYESIFYSDLDKNKIRIYRASTRFVNLYGEEIQELPYRGYIDPYIETCVHPEDRRLLARAVSPDYIKERLAENKSFRLNYRLCQDEIITYMQLCVVNVGSAKHISQIVIGYRNVNDEIAQEMKQMQALENALHEATLANQVKNTFLSNMSHDIRTPMNAIVGYAGLAKNHMHSHEKIAEYLDKIIASSNVLLGFLNNVFEVARIESQQLHIEEIECSLPDMLQYLKMVTGPQARERGISINVELFGILHDRVYCDRPKVTQVLLCLVDNAIKYMEHNGEIRIIVKELTNKQIDHASYQFIVEDNGIGISEEFLQHIFEPFEREKNTTLSGVHGSGLGLTITRGIVEAMGGTIEITSKPGIGSKFVVTLDFQICNQQEDESGDGFECTKYSPESFKILMVDDNEINLEIGVAVLEDAGYQVETAVDGSVAVEKVKQSAAGTYDLILMDLQMPIMNGFEATKAIRQLADPALAKIPIVALSANAFGEDKVNAINSGMNAHLSKPFDVDLLYETIQRMLSDR